VGSTSTVGECRCTHKRTVSGNRCTDCHGAVRLAPSAVPLRDGDKDWRVGCDVCGEKPTVHPTGLCGPCCFGEAETVGGNW
jgi:hypothetical protein